jgi:hypothetical protein
MLDLRPFRPTEHPLNQFFKSHRISKALLAKYLGLSMSRVAHLLLGYSPMPLRYEEKLQQLFESINRGEILK